MAVRTVEITQFGGVDSRSNPLVFPTNRSLRCKNWVRTQAGLLQLRYGYTQPTMSAVVAATIHSAFYYEDYAGNRRVLFGQGNTISSLVIGNVGTVSTLVVLSNPTPWNGIFAANKFFISNGIDFKYYDGATVRDVGIRSPLGTESSSVSSTVSTAAGGFGPTTLSGYQLWEAYYNPLTGHVGNGVTIGSRLTFSGNTNQIVVSNLPNLSGVNVEWQKVIGRTNDNGQVPYIFVDTNGNYIVATNSQTVLTITSPTVDFNSEIPVINDVPPAPLFLAYSLTRCYGVDPADPHLIMYSSAEFDDVAANFVGRPEQSWPAKYRMPFPSGEAIKGIHEVRNEIWAWTRNHLGILTEFGGQTTGGNPVLFWKAVHIGGIANHRAFAQTPYGVFWVTSDKELMTMGENGPLPVSEEYASLIAQISDANLTSCELMYLRDPQLAIDRLYIYGKDTNNNPVIIVHDFRVRDQQSIIGQGSDYLYTGMTPSTFVRMPKSIVSVRDTNGRPRLWAGATDGRLYQLEDGSQDNLSTNTYTADYITIVNMSSQLPLLAGIEFQGDNLSRWYVMSNRVDITESDLNALNALSLDEVDIGQARYRVSIEEASQYVILRVKLDSHPADGNLNPSALLHMPLETYGRIYVGRPELGRGRPEGGRNP